MNKGLTLYALRVTLNTVNERENEIHSPYFEITEYHTTDAELISHLTLYYTDVIYVRGIYVSGSYSTLKHTATQLKLKYIKDISNAEMELNVYTVEEEEEEVKAEES